MNNQRLSEKKNSVTEAFRWFVFDRVQNSKGFSLLTPLLLTVAERTKPASSFSTLSTSSNTEIRAQWELSDFVGQPIESLFIWTDPNDGNCRMQEYCEIILDPSTMGVLGVVDEQPRKYFDVTGLIPGRGQLCNSQIGQGPLVLEAIVPLTRSMASY